MITKESQNLQVKVWLQEIIMEIIDKINIALKECLIIPLHQCLLNL